MTMATGNDDNDVDGDGATGDEVNVDGNGVTGITTVATTMATTTTMATAATTMTTTMATTMAADDDNKEVDGNGTRCSFWGGTIKVSSLRTMAKATTMVMTMMMTTTTMATMMVADDDDKEVDGDGTPHSFREVR